MTRDTRSGFIELVEEQLEISKRWWSGAGLWSARGSQDLVTLLRLGTIAADVVARAIMRGVFHAADIAGHQSYATRWGALLRGSG